VIPRTLAVCAEVLLSSGNLIGMFSDASGVHSLPMRLASACAPVLALTRLRRTF
jgi:hypothetical protein